MNVASSNALIVKETFEEFEQAPVVVYVTVYAPGIDVLTSTNPVEALIESPAVLEKVPPATPVIVGVGSVAFTQKVSAE